MVLGIRVNIFLGERKAGATKLADLGEKKPNKPISISASSRKKYKQIKYSEKCLSVKWKLYMGCIEKLYILRDVYID